MDKRTKIHKEGAGRHQLKKIVADLLEHDDFHAAMDVLLSFPARRVVSPLIGFLYRRGDKRQQRAIDAIGMVTADLAKTDMESARVIMRRLMWSLNDESGGIGWGAPEAMGEIMARHKGLADEYHKILFSYINPKGGNYLEHDALRLDALRGIERLVRSRPELAGEFADHFIPFSNSQDGNVRGIVSRIAKSTGMSRDF